MKLPHSLDIERTFLASLIKNPVVIPEYIEFLNDDLFFSSVHQIIAGAIRFQFKSKKTVDPVILADHIANIGLKNQDDLDVPDYIRTITSRSAVAEANIATYFRDCYKYKVARSTIESCRKTEIAINKAINGSVADIVSATEKGLAGALTASVDDEYKPIDLYDGMPEYLEGLGDDISKSGIMTPFKTWNRWWGPLTKGDLTVVAAPAKAGKSTVLGYIADAPFCNYNKGKVVKVLLLDTELETYRNRNRKGAALSGVNESIIKDGRWKKNEEMAEKVRSQFPKMQSRKGFVKHLYVANVPIEKICNIVRRWALTETDPDDLRIVIYDYFKLTGEKVDDSNKEWQVLGQKVDTFKHLLSEPGVDAAGLAAVQTNGSNDVAASQRIKWFASNVLLWNKKTPEELSEQGEEFGTHHIWPLVLRNQGEDWDNEQYVKKQGDKGVEFKINKLNIKFDNFDLKECGTYADVVKKTQEQIDIVEPDGKKRNPRNKVEEVDLF